MTFFSPRTGVLVELREKEINYKSQTKCQEPEGEEDTGVYQTSAIRALSEHSGVLSSVCLALTMKPCITTANQHNRDVWTQNR